MRMRGCLMVLQSVQQILESPLKLKVKSLLRLVCVPYPVPINLPFYIDSSEFLQDVTAQNIASKDKVHYQRENERDSQYQRHSIITEC